MVGAEHVVDAHINAVFGKRAANAVARGTESVGEAAAHSMVRVGNGRVVEVAHNKDFVPFDAVDKCVSASVCLARSMLDTESFDKRCVPAFHIVHLLGVARNVAVEAAVVGRSRCDSR